MRQYFWERNLTRVVRLHSDSPAPEQGEKHSADMGYRCLPSSGTNNAATTTAAARLPQASASVTRHAGIDCSMLPTIAFPPVATGCRGLGRRGKGARAAGRAGWEIMESLACSVDRLHHMVKYIALFSQSVRLVKSMYWY